MCTPKKKAEITTNKSPIFNDSFFSIQIKNIPKIAKTTAIQPFQLIFLPKNNPSKGANTTYKVVKKPVVAKVVAITGLTLTFEKFMRNAKTKQEIRRIRFFVFKNRDCFISLFFKFYIG